MEITLVQGILIALVAFVCALDEQLEAFMWFRPMVVCFFVGLVLGDVQIGLATGAVAELAYLGLLTIGGIVPPNPLVAGAMTTVIAYTQGVPAEAALGLSLPFALLAQWVGIIFNTLYSGWMAPADRCCARADVKGLRNILLLAWFIKAFVAATIVFMSAYALQGPITEFVTSFPEFLVHGFQVAGGIMPAVGLALLLKVMLNIDNAAYLFIGFLITTYIKPGNVLPVAILALCIAGIGYLATKNKKATAGGDEDDGI